MSDVKKQQLTEEEFAKVQGGARIGDVIYYCPSCDGKGIEFWNGTSWDLCCVVCHRVFTKEECANSVGGSW